MLLLALFGCATVGGTQQTIAFDSRPRGLNLAVNSYISGSEPKTPFTDEVKRARQLTLSYYSGDFVKNVKINCKYRYGTSLLGNLAMAAATYVYPVLAGVVFATGVGLDFLNGSAFECPRMISAEVDLPEAVKSELQESCAPVLILPPKLAEDDIGLSYSLMAEGQEFIKRFDRSCNSFVSPSDTVAALKRSSFNGSKFDELFQIEMEKKLVQILRDTKAARGVDMSLVRQTRTQIEIQFKLVDLYTKKEISSFKKNFSKQKFERLKSGWFRQTLGQSLRLLPNSFALSAASPKLTIEPRIPVRDELIQRDSLVGLLSVTSVKHPDQYDTWDVGFEAGPSLFFDSLHNRITVDEKQTEGEAFLKLNPEAIGSNDFTGYALSVPFDASLSFHTPAGALRGFLGLGLGLYKSTSEQSVNRTLQAYPLAHVGVDWVAYMSKNVFFQVGMHGFGSVNKVILDQRKFVGFRNWVSISVGVGYFFPDTQGYLESWLASKE